MKIKNIFFLTLSVLLFFSLISFFINNEKNLQFKTEAATTSFKFLAWGDTKSGTSTLASLSKTAQTLSPVFTLYSGDVESSGFTTSGFNTWKSAIGSLYSKTFVIRGNHDSGDTSGWQSYFNFGSAASSIGGSDYTALSTNLTYSFIYGNSIIIGIDDPNGEFAPDTSTVSWIDKQLTAAEGKGITHAFLFSHGPIYYVDGHSNTPPSNFITMINKHPIISAFFNGHEHVLATTHLSSSRISGLNVPIEQIGAGSAGADLYSCSSGRSDWCESIAGYVLVNVNGSSFTVDFYKDGSTTPIKSVTVNKTNTTSGNTLTTPTGVVPTYYCVGGNCAPTPSPSGYVSSPTSTSYQVTPGSATVDPLSTSVSNIGTASNTAGGKNLIQIIWMFIVMLIQMLLGMGR